MGVCDTMMMYAYYYDRYAQLHIPVITDCSLLFVPHTVLIVIVHSGQTESGLYCVRFGLVTEDTDLEELIATVYTTGKDVEDSSKVFYPFSCALDSKNSTERELKIERQAGKL